MSDTVFKLNRDERSQFSTLDMSGVVRHCFHTYNSERSCQKLFSNLNRDERSCQTLFSNLNKDERSCQTLFSNSNRNERSTYQAGRRRKEAGSGVAAARARRRERRGGRRRGRCTWESGRGTGGSDDSLPARCSTGSCSLESEERKKRRRENSVMWYY